MLDVHNHLTALPDTWTPIAHMQQCTSRSRYAVRTEQNRAVPLQACEAQYFALGTFALAVSLLDRFLQRTTVRQEDAWAVQLTAVACLSIAAKFEEVNLPYSVTSFQVCNFPTSAQRQARFSISNLTVQYLFPHCYLHFLRMPMLSSEGPRLTICSRRCISGGGAMGAAVLGGPCHGYGVGSALCH